MLYVYNNKQYSNCYIYIQTWTDDLCNADTDADGKTNGEELGDPDCTWTEGMQRFAGVKLS